MRSLSAVAAIGSHVAIAGQRADYSCPLVCFDGRALGVLLPSDCADVRLVPRFHEAATIFDALEPSADRSRLRQLEEAFRVALKTAAAAKIDASKFDVAAIAGSTLVSELIQARADAVFKLASSVTDSEWLAHDALLPAARACLEVERAGVKVDLELLKERHDDPASADAKFLQALRTLHRRGFVEAILDPFGTRTGRFRVRHGFNCLGIPHGRSRAAIVSRFEGGKIYCLDFNAIDYRCLVEAVDDPTLKEFYADCRDFHDRTAQMMFGTSVDKTLRKVVKYLTYVSLYGGSLETVAAKTGLSLPNATQALEVLDAKFTPIHEFRKLLALRARTSGRMRGMTITSDDHDGKILGLYAQSHSSDVFRDAFVAVVRHLRDMKSKVIFTVHDEVVVDAHPDEFEHVVLAGDVMETSHEGVKYPVRVKSGRTYAEASD